MPEQPPPGGEHVVGGAPLGVDVPGPGLAGQQPHPGGQLRPVGQVDAFGRPQVDHAVVAGDEQGGVAREALGDLADQLVDVGQLQPPGLPVGPADMAGAVEVGMVEVDQAAPALAEAAQGPVGLVAEGVGAPVPPPRRAARVKPEAANWPAPTEVTSTPSSAAASKAVGSGWTFSGTNRSRRSLAPPRP